jgi:hypothetical protein
MLLTRTHGNQHDASQSRPVPQPDRTRAFRGFRPIVPKTRLESPKRVCLIGSNHSDGGISGTSGGTSIDKCSSHADHAIPASTSHRKAHLSMLHRRRGLANASQEAKICPACWSWSCRLVSHKLYASHLNRKQPQASFTRKARQWQPRHTDERPSQPFLSASIAKAWTDPLFDLPAGSWDPEMKHYFRDFFTTQVSSMTSPARVRAFDEAYCSVMIHPALEDPALCQSVIAMAATYSAIHRRNLRAPDARLLSIYGRTFKVLRQQTDRAGGGKRPDTIIMATLNLLMCYGIAFGNKSSMAAHPATLRNLVNACGGIFNLSALPAALSLWADYYVTLYTGQTPVFLEQARVMPDIPLSNPPAVVYGRDLDSFRTGGLISQALLDVCLNTCRLTELLEDRVSGNTNQARWEYFNYKRNTMAMRNGMVHSELFGSGTKAECISLIHNLFLFLVLRLMPWNAPCINLCDQLRSALLASGLHDSWGRDIDVLLWVLFTLLAGAESWDDKNWALALLLRTLSHRYGSEQPKWPRDWCESQRLNLVRFTWSDTYLTPSFKTTCRDVEALSQSPTPQSARPNTPHYADSLFCPA